MTDKIPSIQDRSSLNIGGRKNNKKILIIAGFILTVGTVLLSAVVMAITNLTDTFNPEVPVDSEQNYQVGKEDSALDGSHYIARIKAEIERNNFMSDFQTEEIPEEIEEVEIQRTLSSQPEPTPLFNHSSSTEQPLSAKARRLRGSLAASDQKVHTTPVTNTKVDKTLDSPVFANGHARVRKPEHVDFLLRHGSSIPCALYTQIISDYEGLVTCRVTQDVYSSNGVALLVERGSMISGVQRVSLEAGKSRIFTTWSDIETPKGISIRIDSLGAGALGAAGHKAWVDSHFKERFGGAILLSFIDDALAVASRKASDENKVSFQNSEDNANDMAAIALESSIGIKPTGYSRIGQRINILVARDINMSTVYALR